jgi:predicted enzyme related to lactoylglutathione lyase
MPIRRNSEEIVGKAVGIGGVFLKAKDPKGLQTWYHQHLGIPLSEWGFSSFEGPEAQGTTVFSFFKEDSNKFGDPAQRAMINFRVDNLDEVMATLTAAGAKIDPKRDDSEYGKFAWFWDPEGNRVELWEPAEETAAE